MDKGKVWQKPPRPMLGRTNSVEAISLANDTPLSTYASTRLILLTASAICLIIQAAAVACIYAHGFDRNETQAMLNASRLLAPIATTAQLADFLATLDCSAGGDAALRHWRLFYAISGPLYLVSS